MIINFSPIKSLQNIKKINFTSNPIKIQEPAQDTFERQSQSRSPLEQAMKIDECDKKIDEIIAKISPLTEAVKKNFLEGTEISHRADFLRLEERRTGKLSEEKQEELENLIEKHDVIHNKWQVMNNQIEAYKADKKGLINLRERIIASLNPNVAFLLDENSSWIQKRVILSKHPEIIFVRDLLKADDCIYKGIWTNPKYFVINKSNIGNMLDSSYELNRENYERLTKEGNLSYSEYCKAFDMDIKDLHRYISEEYVEPLKLKNILTGEEEPVHIIDIKDNQKNIDFIERCNKLNNYVKESPYINNDYLPAKYLANLGFGTEKELEYLAKTKKLKGAIKPLKVNGEVKDELFIYYKNGSEGELRYLRNRNQNVVNIEQFARRTKMSLSEIEDAILDGTIQPINHYIYEDDKDKMLLNLANPKNSSYIDKKDFEYELIKQEKNKNMSLRVRLAWALSTKTREAAQICTAKSPEIKDIFAKREKIEDYFRRKASGRLQEDEMEPHLTKEEKIKIKVFYKAIWTMAGTDEYKQALKAAKIAIAEYKEGGAMSVQDEVAREALKQILLEEKFASNVQ